MQGLPVRHAEAPYEDLLRKEEARHRDQHESQAAQFFDALREIVGFRSSSKSSEQAPIQASEIDDVFTEIADQERVDSELMEERQELDVANTAEEVPIESPHIDGEGLSFEVDETDLEVLLEPNAETREPMLEEDHGARNSLDVKNDEFPDFIPTHHSGASMEDPLEDEGEVPLQDVFSADPPESAAAGLDDVLEDLYEAALEEVERENQPVLPSAPPPYVRADLAGDLDVRALFEQAAESLKDDQSADTFEFGVEEFSDFSGREDIALLFDLASQAISDASINARLTIEKPKEQVVEIESADLKRALSQTLNIMDRPVWARPGARASRRTSIPSASQPAVHYVPAPVLHRVFAAIVDLTVCLILAVIFVAIVLKLGRPTDFEELMIFQPQWTASWIRIGASVGVVFLASIPLYVPLSFFAFGNTLGFRLSRVELRSDDLSGAGVWRGLLRGLAIPVSVVTILGLLAPLFGRRPLHEWVSRTQLLQGRSR